MTENPRSYPVRLDGDVEPGASRGLWLVKWLLLIPHYVVLVFLWTAFVLVSVIAFFAILFTARYPRGLFDFNVGVMRWSWRVHYYGYGALATDRYPPFTLADVPDYPAHLDVRYPERLSRGLVLVKWWLLAIPHYLIVAVFVGGGVWIGTGGRAEGVWDDGWGAGGLVTLLVLIAGVVLLFSGRYPRPLYDFVLGMDRWAMRVAAYAALMTDEYPPFRMDLGGPDPGSVPVQGTTPPPVGGPAVPPAPTPGSPHRWTAGRVTALVIGSVLLFASAGCLLGGGALLWADRTQRDGGYLSTPDATVSTDAYAITTDSFRLEGAGLDWAVDNVLGRARVEVAPADGDADLFVGIARTADAEGYLRDVGQARVDDLDLRWGGPGERWTTTEQPGGAPDGPPADAGFWEDSASGSGTQTLTWRPEAGDWTVVVMRTDGEAEVVAEMRAGATVPGLLWIAASVLGTGIVLLVIGGLLVGLAVHRAQTPPSGQVPARTGPPTPAGPAGPEPVLSGRPVR